MHNRSDSHNSSANALVLLPVEELLHRLELNFGYAQFAGVSCADLREREELLLALTLRSVPQEVVDAVIERGYREGSSIARDMSA